MRLTIEDASRGLQSGRFTSVALTKAYLARITETEEFHAVLQVNPDALDMARQLDEERFRSGARGYVDLRHRPQTLFAGAELTVGG